MKLPKRSDLLLSMDSVKQLLGDAVADSHTLDTTNGWCKYKEAVRKKIEEKEVWLSRAWKTANIVTFARYIYRYRNTSPVAQSLFFLQAVVMLQLWRQVPLQHFVFEPIWWQTMWFSQRVAELPKRMINTKVKTSSKMFLFALILNRFVRNE